MEYMCSLSGGARYVPGSAGAAGESGAVSKADPFTGSARYVPAGASNSTAGSQKLSVFTALFYLWNLKMSNDSSK